jgi:tetratricopeptide (TPR) repeat protein
MNGVDRRHGQITAIAEFDPPARCTTDGEIAAINLESSRRRAWTRFGRDATLRGIAEAVVEAEGLASRFLGARDALGRLEALASRVALDEDSSRSALLQAEVASTAHRFDDARGHLARASSMDAPADAIERQSLTIDQACGVNLDAVLAARRRIVAASGRPEDCVPLAALLADLERFDEADLVYRQTLRSYGGVSPFLCAWVCFQLGVLWGELLPCPEPHAAAAAYRRAIACLPGYVQARVHLAEIDASHGRADEAETLLRPALSSGDPEVAWRLADVLILQGRSEEARVQLEAARAGYEWLVATHVLAFADHAAEFYAGSGDDHPRALELAQINAANRATSRAVRQVQAIEASMKSESTTGETQ